MPEQFARYGERGIPFGYTGVGVLESAGAGIALANESDAHVVETLLTLAHRRVVEKHLIPETIVFGSLLLKTSS